MMINETRILNEFIELVSVPCPSKDEKAEADLLRSEEHTSELQSPQ